MFVKVCLKQAAYWIVYIVRRKGFPGMQLCQGGEKHMKKRLQRILSILCVLMLVTGCLMLAASADEPNTIKVITARWEDEDDYEGLRPKGDIIMSINGTDVHLNAGNEWTGSAEAPADAKWTFATVEGYDSPVESGTSDVKVVTYRHNVPTTYVKPSVVWNDGDDKYGLRPDSVRINLLADGKIFRTPTTATAGSGWNSDGWVNIPQNREGTTDPITYSIEAADQVPGYAASVEGSKVVYTLQKGALTLKISVNAPDGVDVSGLKLSVSGPNWEQPITGTYGEWGSAVVFNDVLPGAYVVQEENADTLVEGYVMDPANSKVGDAVYVDPDGEGTLTFMYTWIEPKEEEPNEHPETSESGLSFDIIGPNGYFKTITYAEFTDGRYVLEGLAPGSYAVIERNAEGLVQAYTLKSESVTGMTVMVGADGEPVVLFNSYVPLPTPTPETELIDIPVTKIWNDNNDKDGNRPKSITVQLYANGVLNDTHTITEADGWKYVFKDKDRTDEQGELIEYTVKEEPVEWYTSVVNGFAITNIYKPEVTSASVLKIWDDKDNAQHIRPSSIAVTLLPVGEVYVLNEANGWFIEKTDLPTKINGEPVTYSWKEEEIVGYTLSGQSAAGAAYVFTNRAREIPKIPPDQPQPKTPGGGWVIFEEYDTALGGELLINHVGDCFD